MTHVISLQADCTWRRGRTACLCADYT